MPAVRLAGLRILALPCRHPAESDVRRDPAFLIATRRAERLEHERRDRGVPRKALSMSAGTAVSRGPNVGRPLAPCLRAPRLLPSHAESATDARRLIWRDLGHVC